MGNRSYLLGFAFVVPALIGVNEAYAYNCSRVADSDGDQSGPSLSWSKRSIPFTFFAGGTRDIADELEFEVLRDSFAAWVGVLECRSPSRGTDISFVEIAARSTTDRVGYNFTNRANNENLLIFRDNGWPIPGQESSVIALTTVTYNPLTGEILDADIEFNSTGFRFSADATNSNDMDLMNAAVHEIGHLLGLDHSTEPDATMEFDAYAGETKKRTLECDDRDGVVFKYPEGGPNGYCDPVASCGYCAPPLELAAEPEVDMSEPDSGGCGCGATRTAPLGLGLALLAGLGLIRFVRSRDRSSRVLPRR